jgi:DsbC/DsbD-like thiol-disulfide interchange protein
MSLVLPASGVKPNSKVWIGWRIQREDGWHTYWKHPGNVGLTPHLEWELHQGIEVGELQFPHPQRVQMAGVKAYGHYGETLYLAELQVADVPIGSEVKLRAKARWMVCSHVCLPQYNKLSISLPVVDSPESDPQWEARFAEFLQDRPLPLPPAWKMQATELGQFTKLTIFNAPNLSGKELYFFGGSYLVCSDAEQKVRNQGNSTEMLLPKPTWPEENPTHLQGMLRVINEDGKTRHYPLKAPLN